MHFKIVYEKKKKRKEKKEKTTLVQNSSTKKIYITLLQYQIILKSTIFKNNAIFITICNLIVIM